MDPALTNPGRRLFALALLPLAASLVAAAGWLGSRGPALPPATGEPIALVGATAIPMDAERVLPDQTLIIEDGVIVAMGARASVTVPRSARRIEAAGKFLIPGLVDMHVHLDEDDAEQHLQLYLAHGVTTIQSMHGSPWHLELRQRLRDGELIGPAMFTTGPTTARAGVSTPDEARAFVAEQKAMGYDAIKQYGNGRGTMTRETYDALLAAARDHGMRVVGHAPRSLPFSAVLEEGQNSIDHMEEVVYTSKAIGEIFKPYLDVQFGRASPEDHPEVLERLPDLERLEPALDRLARQVRASGLAITPTLIAFGNIQKMTTDDIYTLMEAPQMAYIHPVTRVQWSPAFNRYRSGGWASKLELMAGVLERSHELQMILTRTFHRAGVPIMAGTDAPLVFVFPGYSLHQELAYLVEAGLTPYEALEAATVIPAHFLGVAASSGTIAVGKRADLVLLEADPTRDITNTTRIAGVMRDGAWMARERLDQVLADIAAGYQALNTKIAPVAKALQEGRAEEALQAYRAGGASEIAFFVERAVNSLGYRRLNAGDVEGALETFVLNTEYFPEAFNTWDSLAEAYMVRGDDELAIRYYTKSLELNPENDNARMMIERIKSKGSSR